MKHLNDFRQKKQMEVYQEANETPPDPPAILILKRKYIRMFPGNVKVAVYYSDKLKKYITVPYSDVQLGEGVDLDPKPFEDKNLEILKNIVATHKDDTIRFSDGTEYDVDTEVANAILSIYARCSDENKEKMEMTLTKGVGGFMKLAKFAMQNQ
jgi:hypothetical protein